MTVFSRLGVCGALWCAAAAAVGTLLFHRSATRDTDTVRVSLSNLTAITERCIKQRGYEDVEVRLITDVLLYAQLRGNNQGLIKIVTGAIPRRPAGGLPTVEHTSDVSARVDGRGHLGMLVMNVAAEQAAAKAFTHGVGVVGTVNSSSTTGAIGYYARELAHQGLICIVMAQSPELVCPYGSYKPFFGTNPIAFGIPAGSGREPVVFDMATSAIAYYGVVEAAMKGDPIPADVAYSRSGSPTTNAEQALAGALRPFDRAHKGSGLALMVELLTGAWVGGALVDKSAAKNWGNLVIALHPHLFRSSAASLGTRVQTVLGAMKQLPRLPGVNNIYAPGERSHQRFADHVLSGMVSLPRRMYDTLRAKAGGE